MEEKNLFVEDENLKETENSLSIVSNDISVLSNKKSEVEKEYFTTIDDQKKLFNLESNVDFKINDCIGETLRVTDVLIKKFVKNLKDPEIDEQTGEILKDKEIKLVTILIDDQDKSYVTASKTFGYNMKKYIEMFGLNNIHEGIEIKIIEIPVKNSVNKALSFELV